MKIYRNIFIKKSLCAILVLISISLFSCQKDLKINGGYGEIKQVIIAYLNADSKLEVNISKSKTPDDFNPIDFLPDCKVDLYEDGIFKETMQFYLKDTLSGLGYYRSTFNLIGGKTYKIISTHNTLGVTEATDYLPTKATVLQTQLLAHADSLHTTALGKYSVQIQDSTQWQDYYYIAAFYSYTFLGVNNNGDSVLKTAYASINSDFGISNNISNNTNITLFKDTDFDGQLKTFTATFNCIYNPNFKSLTLHIQVTKCSVNYYDLILYQISRNTADFNSGQFERVNYPTNIINGFGHFSAQNSTYYKFDIY